MMAAQMYPAPVPLPHQYGQVAGPAPGRAPAAQTPMQQPMHPGGGGAQLGKQNAKDSNARGPSQQGQSFPKQFVPTFHGWILKKCPADPLQPLRRVSWQFAERHDLPVNVDEYMRSLKTNQKKRKTTPLQDYWALNSENQRKQIDRLISDQKAKELNPNATWVLAHFQCKTRQVAPRATEISSMTVVLRREPKLSAQELEYELNKIGNSSRIDVGARPDVYNFKDNRNPTQPAQGYQQQMQNVSQNMNGGQQYNQQPGFPQPPTGQGKQNGNIPAPPPPPPPPPPVTSGGPPQQMRGPQGQPIPPPPPPPPPPQMPPGPQPTGRPAPHQMPPAPMPPQHKPKKVQSKSSMNFKNPPGNLKSAQKVNQWMDRAEFDSDSEESTSNSDRPVGRREDFKPRKKSSMSAMPMVAPPPMGKYAQDARNGASQPHFQPSRRPSEVNLRGGAGSPSPAPRKRITTTTIKEEFGSSSSDSSGISDTSTDEFPNRRGHRRHAGQLTPQSSFDSKEHLIVKARPRQAAYSELSDYSHHGESHRGRYKDVPYSRSPPSNRRDSYHFYEEGSPYEAEDSYRSTPPEKHYSRPMDIEPYGAQQLPQRPTSMRGPDPLYRHTVPHSHDKVHQQASVPYPPHQQGRISQLPGHRLPAPPVPPQYGEFGVIEEKRKCLERLSQQDQLLEQKLRQRREEDRRYNDYQQHKESQRRLEAEDHMLEQQIRERDQEIKRKQAELARNRQRASFGVYPGRREGEDW